MQALKIPSGRRHDLVCLGRLAVDLYAQQVGARLEDVSSFAKYLGDSSANIAFGALENTGMTGTKLSFAAKTLTWVKVVIDQSSGGNPGIGEIVKAAYPDPTALEEKSPYFDAKATEEKNPWSALDVAFVEVFPNVLGLSFLKQQAALEQMPLVQKGSRLSVMPVTDEQWAAVLGLR